MHLKLVKHVACFLSGGTDSAVAALLLKRKGYYVTGLFLNNQLQNQETLDRQKDNAYRLGQLLEIPLQEVNLTSREWSTFTRPIIKEYRNGGCPSVDVLFHRHITFGGLFERAITELGADFVASGHFARTTIGEGIDKWSKYQGSRLLRAVDLQADESYRLSQVPQACLQKSYFPLGDFSRDVLLKIVRATELKNVFQDCSLESPKCIDEDSLMREVKKEVPSYEATVVDFELGQKVGKIEDASFMQRGDAVNISGGTYYISDIDRQDKIIQVVKDFNHPSLYCDTMFTSLAHWCYKTPYNFFEKHMMDAEYRFRYNQPLTKCTLTVGTHNEWCGNDHVILSSSQPMRAVVPGHVTAFYQGEECIGSARILRSGPSKYFMNHQKCPREQKSNIKASKNSPINNFFRKILPDFS